MTDETQIPLLAFAETETQRKYVLAITQYGSHRKAAEALDVTHSAIDHAMKLVKARASRQGHAPGHWDSGTPAGYEMGKVTIQRKQADGTYRWERHHPKLEEIRNEIRAAVDAFKEEIPPSELPEAPRIKDNISEKMCVHYVVTDYHMGMKVDRVDGDDSPTSADWDLEIAEETLVQAILHLSDKAPAAALGLLFLMGDLLHFDGPDPVTPTNRHPLDAAGRQRMVVRVTVRALRRVIRQLKTRHGKVRVMVNEGNHDLSSTPWLRELLLIHYEDDPDVEIIDNDLPYQAVEFGVNFIGSHHGHKKKKEKLPILFAAMFREMWGRTRKGYIHTGHYHEADEKEHPGVRVIQHNTLAAPDNHCMRSGYLSEREMAVFYYHHDYGCIGRDIVTPEMLKIAA